MSAAQLDTTPGLLYTSLTSVGPSVILGRRVW
jgi:hypothetical protein